MRRQGGAGTIAALLLCCVFGVAALLSLTAGAGIYRQVAQRTEDAGERRVGLTYLAAKVRGFDEAGKVLAGAFGDGDAVYLLQDIDGLTYETILYVHDGWLKELLCERGWELEPEDGQAITPARGLEAALTEEGLLRLAYTGGDGRTETAALYVRSGG